MRPFGSRRAAWAIVAIAALMLVGFGVRLALGMRTQVDGDEATLALAGLHLTHGQFVLMEPNDGYLGALDAYVTAPFIALMGPGAIPIRLALAVVGAIYVLSMYVLGRMVFDSRRAGLLAAFVAAVFPLFTVYWSTKLRGGYAELPVFEAIALALCAQIGWRGGARLRWWALLGFVAGLALWSEILIVVVVAVIAVALLLRAPAIGWRAWRRGVAVSCIAGLLGLAPWLAYNVANHLHSIRALPKYHTGFSNGVSILLNHQLPAFVGGTSSCGHDVVSPAISDLALGALIVALLWLRRRSLKRLLTGDFAGFEPLDVALALLPITLVYLVVSRNDAIPCEPRYLMPLGVPLAIGLVALLRVSWPWRAMAAVASAAWLIISGLAAAGPLPDMFDYVRGTQVPVDLAPGIAMIRAQHPSAIWAQYWLSRPLSYFSGDTLPIAEYGGPVGFLDRQQEVETAAHPSWLFVAGQVDVAAFEKTCYDRGISYLRVTGGGLVLYTDLSATVEPPDVFPGPLGHIN